MAATLQTFGGQGFDPCHQFLVLADFSQARISAHGVIGSQSLSISMPMVLFYWPCLWLLKVKSWAICVLSCRLSQSHRLDQGLCLKAQSR